MFRIGIFVAFYRWAEIELGVSVRDESSLRVESVHVNGDLRLAGGAGGGIFLAINCGLYCCVRLRKFKPDVVPVGKFFLKGTIIGFL